MSNAKSRLRLIEPVRVFDEQRVNIAGSCQRIRGYCLYSSARPYTQSLTHEEPKRGREREEIAQRAWRECGSAWNKRLREVAPNRSHLLERWRTSRAIAATSQATKMRFCPRHRNTPAFRRRISRFCTPCTPWAPA